jgi:cytochrome c peroxidase
MKLRVVGFATISFFVAILSQAPVYQGTQSDLPKSEEELGKRLFMDSILSEDHSISCASCHIPEYAFADTSALSKGVGGKLGTRNTPSAMNMVMRPFFFWDGRAATLEEQALGPIENPVEMNLPLDSAVARLQRSEYYQKAFQQIYGKAPSKEGLASAIAAFERTLETGSPYDRYADGDESAISESAKRGIEVFNEKGKCFDCHFGPDMTGDEFRNIGTFNGNTFNDVGRFEISKDSADLGRFKVPSLRNVAVTAPYMHDGSFKTLREVIEYYNTPNKFRPHAINRDTLLLEPLGMTESEMDDLEAFLESLTAPRYLPLLKELKAKQKKEEKKD